MKRKSIRLKALTVGVTAILAIQTPVMSLQAAAASTQYLSEVILSYGKTDDEAKSWLTQNGYKVVGQNLNEGGEGGSDAFSWLGLASEKRSVYLGYKTTTNPEEAITDMKIMNMNGGYSYEAYEKVLADTAAEKEHFLQNIMAALKEYRENYKKGAVKAKIAHDNLNKFKDDDSGALMGDLLLNSLKTEDEAAWEADKTQHADMVTILMQGNSTCVSEIMQNLAFAADTADDSFVNRAIAAANAEESPFDTFFDAYMEKHPGSTKDEAVTDLMRLYDDDAKMFASSLIGLRNYLSNYTMCELSVNATPEETDQYFATHNNTTAGTWAGAANLYTLLSDISYGDSSLASYLVYTEDDYLADSALLSGYDALGLPQRAKLYPLIAQMSQGQRALLEYTAMDRMLTMGLMDADTWASTYATMQDAAIGAADFEPCSVFAEVNRNDFKVGEIAVTNMAQGKQASTGEEINEGLFGVGVSYLTAGLFVGGMATTISGIAIAAKNWSSAATGLSALGTAQQANLVRDTVLSRDSLASLNEAGNVVRKITGYGHDLLKPLNNMNKMLGTVRDSAARIYMGSDPQELLQTFQKFSKDTLDTFITKAGPNAEVAIDRFLPQVDDATMTVTFSDGNVWDLNTNTITFHEELNISNQIQYVKPTPDIIWQRNQANQALKDMLEKLGKTDKELTELNTSIGKALDAVAYEENGDFLRKYLISKGLPENNDFYQLSQKQVDEFADFMSKNYPDAEVTKSLKQAKELKVVDYLEAKKQAKNLDDLMTEVDDIAAAGKEGADKLDDAAEAAMTAGSGSTFWKWFGVGMAIVGLIMSAYSVYAAIDEMKAYYHQEMLPIPRKMVDLGYYADGTTCYIYYDCVKCNRTAMNMGNETLGDYGDLNGDVMKQWLALYTTKDSRAGNPIQASIIVKKGTTSMPMKTVPLSFFGFKSAVNMTDTKYTYNNAKNGIYLYYKQDAAAYTGTVATGNLYVTVGVLSALGGAGICGILIALLGKRRKKDEQPTETQAA